MPPKIEEILHDGRYMWVALSVGEKRVPEMVFQTAEEAADALLETDYLLQPVPVYEWIGIVDEKDKQEIPECDQKHMWIIVNMEREAPMILFLSSKNAASYIYDDRGYCMKPLKICKTLEELK